MKIFGKAKQVALTSVIVFAVGVSFAQEAEATTAETINRMEEILWETRQVAKDNNATLLRIENILEENRGLFDYLRCKEEFFIRTLSSNPRYTSGVDDCVDSYLEGLK